jgi:hypothetical protein
MGDVGSDNPAHLSSKSPLSLHLIYYLICWLSSQTASVEEVQAESESNYSSQSSLMRVNDGDKEEEYSLGRQGTRMQVHSVGEVSKLPLPPPCLSSPSHPSLPFDTIHHRIRLSLFLFPQNLIFFIRWEPSIQ